MQDAAGEGVHDNQRDERTAKRRRGWDGSDGWLVQRATHTVCPTGDSAAAAARHEVNDFVHSCDSTSASPACKGHVQSCRPRAT